MWRWQLLTGDASNADQARQQAAQALAQARPGHENRSPIVNGRFIGSYEKVEAIPGTLLGEFVADTT